MKRIFTLALLGLVAIPLNAWGLSNLSSNLTTATVLIANYNANSEFLGWGSGFFVDEGIVVTNKHVINVGNWYRVYATTANEAVDFNCYKKITKSDVKINLDDDVAYMRAFLPCSHGVLRFANDPKQGDPVSVVGYPYNGSADMTLTVTSGVVTGRTQEGWLSTDAHLDFGNSGGPVLNASEVVGVAVAKGIDAEGNYVEGYFIPSSVIESGLLYANDSGFGYTPQIHSSSSRSSSSRSSSLSSVSLAPQSSRRSGVGSSSSRPSMSPLQERTCKRVEKYRKDANVLYRLNQRLMKRYGFRCV